MKTEVQINYLNDVGSSSGYQTSQDLVQMILARMPEVWLDRYHRMCDGPTNVLQIPVGQFSYLFDYCTELVDAGNLAQSAREDRAVVAVGLAQSSVSERDAFRLRGFPGSDERGDRGHL